MSEKNRNFGIKGAWNIEQTEDYLLKTRYPIRLSTLNANGYPLVTSVWYLYDNGLIWCAVQKESDIARNIKNDKRCGFEVGPNQPPYMGVRGQGIANLVPERGKEKLEKLIGRFLDRKNKDLADWLMNRADSETAIMIEPEWFFTWDYSGRMN